MTEIITKSEKLDLYLSEYKSLIGDDFAGYRGHLYRVLNYTLYFLNYDETNRDIIEFALVHHDIGLWSDQELAYLEPSIERAKQMNADKKLGYDDNLVFDLIFNHHKVTSYKKKNAPLVNAFRKADWIDATKGRITKGMPLEFIHCVNGKIPANGFYDTLDRLGSELSGQKKLRMMMKFMKVFKW